MSFIVSHLHSNMVAMTRIQKRLGKTKKVVAPPTLQVGPAPFEHLTEEIMLSRESLLVILKSDIQFVVQQARYHSVEDLLCLICTITILYRIVGIFRGVIFS